MDELAAGAAFGEYKIEGEAGRGGMGVVYRAKEKRLKRKVALKVVAPQLASQAGFRDRFERECELAAAIDHPNVVPIYHAGEQDGRLFVTMRFIEGTDLAALLARDGKLQPAAAAEIVAEVAAGLDAAHSRGFVHRDVKPENILIEQEAGGQHIFLTDFGVTKRVASDSVHTATGFVVGTMNYMAPEQLEAKPVDARADVFSLGCVLYQCLTGELPFPGETLAQKLNAITNRDPKPPSKVVKQLPRGLDEVIARALEKDPKLRFQSAGDLGSAAVAAAKGGSLPREGGSVAAVATQPGAAENGSPTGEAESSGGTKQSDSTKLADGTKVAGAGAGVPGSLHRSRDALRRLPKAVWAGAGVLVLAGLLAIILLGSGSGSSSTSQSSSGQSAAATAAPAFGQEEVQRLLATLAFGFDKRDLGAVDQLLVPGAPYDYPGAKPDSIHREYRDLFQHNTGSIRKHSLQVVSLQPQGSSAVADAAYQYLYRFKDGAIEFRRGSMQFTISRGPSGEPLIAGAVARPDLSTIIENIQAPVSYQVTTRAGRNGPIVGSGTLKGNPGIPGGNSQEWGVTIKADPAQYSAWNLDGDLYWSYKGSEASGPGDFTYHEGYPWAD